MSANLDMQEADQEGINTFNKGWTRLKEIRAEAEGLKKLEEDCEELSNELIINDDEQIRYVVGECFYHADPDEAEERVQSKLEGIKFRQETLATEQEELQTTIDGLKKKLYSKFGNTINLEE